MNTLKFQQRVLGFLCLLLPYSAVLFGLFGVGKGNLPHWYFSISETYYSSSAICMIGLLFSTALYFFCYQGYDWKDRVASCLSAIFALGIISFPTSTIGSPQYSGLFAVPARVSDIFHVISAGGLFITFALNIMFLFTLGNSGTEQKKKRNIVYYVCGSVILAGLIVETIGHAWFFYLYPDIPITMIDETIMLTAFAIAWLTKSGLFKCLNDYESKKE